MRAKGFILGFGLATAGRALIPRLLLLKFARDVRRLNAGDYSGLLAAYADDFVLHFNEGDHRQYRCASQPWRRLPVRTNSESAA
jgi:hypothetical protein